VIDGSEFGWGRCATSAGAISVDHRRPARSAVSLARGAVRSHRSAVWQQARHRILDRLRRLRLARRRTLAVGGALDHRSARRLRAIRNASPGSMDIRRRDTVPVLVPPPDVPPWTEQERLDGKSGARFFISGHPPSPSTAPKDGAFWEPHDGDAGHVEPAEGHRRRVVTVVKRQNLKRRGRNTRASRSRIFTARGGVWCSRGLGKLTSDPGRWCVSNQRWIHRAAIRVRSSAVHRR